MTAMPTNTEIATSIREAREAAGLSKYKLAQVVGVAWKTVDRWESVDPAKWSRPDWNNSKALADTLGLTMEELGWN